VPHVELALVRLCVGDEFLEIVGRKVLANREQLRLLGDKPDRLEILLRVTSAGPPAAKGTITVTVFVG